MLKALPADNFDYKPPEKSISLDQLANHIVGLLNWVGMSFTTDLFDFHKDYVPSALTTLNDLVDLLESGHDNNLVAVEALTEDGYWSIWNLQSGDHIIAFLPKAGAYRFLITNHLIYHRGQLSVYLRLLDIPDPGIYGPSADEKAN